MPPKKTVTPSRAKVPAKGKTPPAGKTGSKAATSKTTGNKTTNPQDKKKSTADSKPKEKVWTKEDEASCKIQKHVRVFLARKKLERKRIEKEKYEEKMQNLEKEAFVHMVKMQQEEVERQMKKDEEERKRKREEVKRKKRMLEAAYDGDNDSILDILQEVREIDDKNNISKDDVIGKAVRNKHILAMIECEDANENTPLSEAASGGHVPTIQLLLDYEADPNSKGQFQRTPLYRAAFAGHLEACQVLIQNGGDPRMYASDGQTAEQVASVPAIQEMLQSWDISKTESLLKRIESSKEKRLEEHKKQREAEQSKLEGVVEEALKDYQNKQKQLQTAHCELNKRIVEHDKAVLAGFDRPELLVQTIHDAELELETVKIHTEKARDKLAQARLRLREKQAGDDESDVSDNLPGVKVAIRELEEVLLRDVGNKIRDSGKWPLIIDTSGQASTFLRYRDTNVINALRQQDMEPNRIRLALLGAIRYGKPLVIDMMQVDMYEVCRDRFDEVHKGLMDSILDSSLLKDEKYLSLVKPDDGEEYSHTKHFFVENFKLFIVCANPYPSESLLNQMYPIRIILPS
ncbi:hypothetical protein LOTGIDRAFT_215456 [Lottia gigantea]|uniref:Uncharacterized protein n=1 Tax=Lottia gigantea TaxID=225164 RepID=V4ALM5_LOTGI|nr:hypothetical protein LOTGIDRAFT_215456 [Lottia gigantea]ESO94491.1 hypothetical protein LOTGIDRAFT_215456 [Lottia gigantea]